MGKSLLLERYPSNSRFHGSRKGKKTFNNEHGSKSHDFFESSVMQVFIYAYFFVLVEFHSKRVRLDGDITVNLLIRNPSAMNWFRTMRRRNYPKDAAIVVYDITQRYSFERAKDEVDRCTKLTRPGAFVALVGNKADLEFEREVSFEVSNVVIFI